MTQFHEVFVMVGRLTLPLNKLIYTVTCKGLRVTKITGSGSDYWIYWHFGYNLS
jgi:hypothetical protein